MSPRTCQEWAKAKSLGLKRYSIGKPCKHGHLAERYTASRMCVVCAHDHCVKQKRKNLLQEAFRQANRDKSNEWSAKNRERAIDKAHYYRAKRLKAPGSHTKEQIKQLAINQGFLCASCAKSIAAGWHRDHIIPISRGGSNDITNIQLLCAFCNLSKRNKTLEEWNAYKSYMAKLVVDHGGALAYEPKINNSRPKSSVLP